MKTVQIFLASSAELADDRLQFEVFINRKNKTLVQTGVFLDLQIWEDFNDSISQTRLQDEYNAVVASSDVVLCLFSTKVGKYTEEEFLTALNAFKSKGKPLVYTYFKNSNIDTRNIVAEDLLSLINFKKKLSDMGHFYTNYENTQDLLYRFSEQLNKILVKEVKSSQTQGMTIQGDGNITANNNSTINIQK